MIKQKDIYVFVIIRFSTRTIMIFLYLFLVQIHMKIHVKVNIKSYAVQNTYIQTKRTH